MQEELTPRELQVLRLVAQGKSTKLIASELGISFKTAATHRYSAKAKIGASNAAGMVCLAVQLGLVPSHETDALKVIPAPISPPAEITQSEAQIAALQASIADSQALQEAAAVLRAELLEETRKTRRLLSELAGLVGPRR